jgi:hypothetical protein
MDRTDICAKQRPAKVSMDGCSLAGEMDLLVAAVASAEASTETGKDCVEDFALYELD